MMGYWSVFFVCKSYGPAASSPALLSTTLQQAAASLATQNAVFTHTHTYIYIDIHTYKVWFWFYSCVSAVCFWYFGNPMLWFYKIFFYTFVVVVAAVDMLVYGAHASLVCTPNRAWSVITRKVAVVFLSLRTILLPFCCKFSISFFSCILLLFFITSIFLSSVVVFMISFICNCLEWSLSAFFYLSRIFSTPIDTLY